MSSPNKTEAVSPPSKIATGSSLCNIESGLFLRKIEMKVAS